MPPEPDEITRALKWITSTRPEEIGCDDCLAQVGAFAERELSGKPVPQALVLVGEHLDRCEECREEYEALLEALRTLDHPADEV